MQERPIIVKFLLVLVLAITTSGCSSILNPYESEFMCAEQSTFPGKCVTLGEAYKESLLKEGQPGNYDTPGMARPSIAGEVSNGQYQNNNSRQDPFCPDCAPKTQQLTQQNYNTDQGQEPNLQNDPSMTITGGEAGTGGAMISQLSKNKTSVEKDYEGALLKRYTGLLRQPATPMVTPTQVVRVLMLPYRGDSNELFAMRYAYIIVDEPKWVIDNYLIEQSEN